MLSSAGLVRDDYAIDGAEISVYRRDLAKDDDAVDPCFFDEGYTVAASTGLAKVCDRCAPHLLRML